MIKQKKGIVVEVKGKSNSTREASDFEMVMLMLLSPSSPVFFVVLQDESSDSEQLPAAFSNKTEA